MAHMYFQMPVLEKFVGDAFQNVGFTKEESAIITDVLLTADMYGIESHGMQRLSRYDNGLKSGLIKKDAEPEVVFETPISAVIDGHDGMGQLISYKAMTMAIEKAKQNGIGIVTARNSNHYGIAGYYALMAVKEGLVGLSTTNSEAIMVPTFASKAMLGSNPLAVAVPADPYPFFFDASTSVVTRGKLEMYRKAEKELPDGWALNKYGKPSTDADDVLKNIVAKAGGGIMPLGGNTEKLGSHKGYGYGMLVELLSSIASMGITSNHTHQNGKGGTCHGFIALNPAIFGDPDALKEHFSTFLQELRDAPKAEGAERIYTHGEKEALAVDRVKENGVPVDVKTVIEMKQMADRLGMDFAAYFGDLDLDTSTFSSIYS
ncbi:MAG: Ldh family oxidoreductase [Clostridia bacterium]|nr:Ldh family oxidoreductase [Clostridia bacterium]MBQ6525742.1 Ldh family oxidoreductase [Clostridia bacterium]